MATSQKKTSGSRASSGGRRSAASKGKSTVKGHTAPPAPRPFRREAGAAVCLLLAVFSAFGYFNLQAIFIDFFCGVVKGLIGYGYLLLPPMLLVASGILAFHRGRPVQLRVWCALLLPVLAGGLLHLFLAKGAYNWNLDMVKLLWTQGETLTSGGVVSGGLALGLTAVFSKIGAGIVSLDDLEKVLKINSKSKILKFWTLFIPKKEKDEGDETADSDTAPDGTAAAEQGEPQFVMAECCKPIPGDKVVGYRDPATGNIIVHKATCDELNRLAAQFGRNIVKEEIKWSQHKAMSYLVTVELRGIDRMGILLDLAKVVSGDFSINIREINIHSHDGIFEGSISLYVKDAESLYAVMDRLRGIKGIESVKRTMN